jgi:DNA-binding SARP family transcriptional activator
LLLAVLANDAGGPVTLESIIDRVWGDHPPLKVRRAILVRICQVRRLIKDAVEAEAARTQGGPGARIARWSGGYLLQVDRDQVDLHRFRRLVGAARCPGRSDTDRVSLLGEALGLWTTDQPLAGLSGEWVRRMRSSWALDRLDATVDWARAALRLGQTGAVLSVVRNLVDEHPLNEALAAVLVRALAADGRKGEALACWAATSARLVQDLGVGPSGELRALQKALLHDQPLPPDPSLPPQPESASADLRGCPGHGCPGHGRCRTAAAPAESSRHRTRLAGQHQTADPAEARVGGPPAAIRAASWSSQHLTPLARALGHRCRPLRHGPGSGGRDAGRRQQEPSPGVLDPGPAESGI